MMFDIVRKIIDQFKRFNQPVIKTYNYSIDSEYHSQRNNQIIPHLSCNTTSVIMAIKQAIPGWQHFFNMNQSLKSCTDKEITILEEMEPIKGKILRGEVSKNLYPFYLIQPEDYMSAFLQTQEAYNVMKAKVPTAFKDGVALYRPQQVHIMLVWAANELISNIASFKILTLTEILNIVSSCGGAVLNGIFPQEAKDDIDHFISVSGYTTTQTNSKSIDLSLVQEIIIDDPYGDFRTDYVNQRGNDIRLTKEEFHNYFKPMGAEGKWAIVLK
jgi:hypothetical protein